MGHVDFIELFLIAVNICNTLELAKKFMRFSYTLRNYNVKMIEKIYIFRNSLQFSCWKYYADYAESK